ncbi:MAG: hypothetical protein PHT24_07230 [Endomicrobiaceae bacterium]|nr:hypothetical protein [Endomicrobiaceae bacterium]
MFKKFFSALFLLTVMFSLSSADIIKTKPIFVIGQDSQSIEEFFSSLKQFNIKEISYPDGIMVYTSINSISGLDEPSYNGAGVNYADDMIKNYPDIKVVQIGLYMKDMLDEVINGSFDDNIDKLGTWIKNSNKDVYLRIGYECDNTENDYNPEKYINAYRYIANRLKNNTVTNVHFVWHIIAWNSNSKNPYNPMIYYPGDDCVNMIGISFFDVSAVKERKIAGDIASAKKKPLMIAESSPFNRYTVENKAAWINALFKYVKDYKVSFISYINVNWDELPMFEDQKWGDARLQQNKKLMKLWSDGIKQFKK